MIYETVRLGKIAYARSGDKGAHANIGVISYTKEGYDFLFRHLTEEKVLNFFYKLEPIAVRRYALPNLWALNFVLEGVLSGGASLSLRADAQGKALGQAILEMPMRIEENLIGSFRKP